MHEKVIKRIASVFFSAYDGNNGLIDHVSKYIQVTNHPKNPNDKVAMVLSDANMSYL